MRNAKETSQTAAYQGRRPCGLSRTEGTGQAAVGAESSPSRTPSAPLDSRSWVQLGIISISFRESGGRETLQGNGQPLGHDLHNRADNVAIFQRRFLVVTENPRRYGRCGQLGCS